MRFLTLLLLLLGSWGCLESEIKPVPTITPSSASTIKPTPMISPELWAGNPEQAGFIDGPRETARFRWPTGLSLDLQDNLYVADANNHKIRKSDTSGFVSTIAGDGFTDKFGDGGYLDGPALGARLNFPYTLLLLRNKEIWFSDLKNHMLRRINLNGTVSTILAVSPLPSDYKGPSPPPFPLLKDASCINGNMVLGIDGQVYNAASEYICRIEANSQVTKLAGQPWGYTHERSWILDSHPLTSILDASDLVFDKKGNIYVSDKGHHLIRKINSDWSEITTVAGDAKACQEAYTKYAECMYIPPEKRMIGNVEVRNNCHAECASGYRDGPAEQAMFHQPEGLVLDFHDNLYIADVGNNRIRKLSPNGLVSTVAEIPSPIDIVLDKQGYFYVSTGAMPAIYKFKLQ